MEMNDAQRTELARRVMLEAAERVTEADSQMSAVLIVTDGAGLFVTPLRLTREQTFSLLVAACSALEPAPESEQLGELH